MAKKATIKGTPKKTPVKKSADPQQKTIEQVIEQTEQKTVEAVQEQTPEPEQKTVEVKEQPTQKAVDPEAVFTINGKKQYWRNKIYLPSVGLIDGPVLVKHKAEFFQRSPGSDLEKWMDKIDHPFKRAVDAMAKRRRKLGLDAKEIEDPDHRERLGLKPL